MKKQQGRKALIILSDGVDHGSKKYLEDAVESAPRHDRLRGPGGAQDDVRLRTKTVPPSQK